MEACVDSFESAVEAEKGGASRVELVSDIFGGGVTPSMGTIWLTTQKLVIPVFVIIRPRPGDFCYSQDEFEIMKFDIQNCARLGAKGVVFGILLPNGDVDKERCGLLVELAHNLSMQTTFHRAFDMARDPMVALEDLISLKFERVLTSGQDSSCLEGLDLLVSLTERANKRIIVVPGGGINERNVSKILTTMKAVEFHGSARTKKSSKMTFRNERCSMGGNLRENEFVISTTDHTKVSSILENSRK